METLKITAEKRDTRHYCHRKFEDTKGVIKRRKDNTLADRKRDKRTNNDLQNITEKA
jgi:hypothetical protein